MKLFESIPDERLAAMAFSLAEMDKTSSFEQFTAKAGSHMAALQRISQETRPLQLTRALAIGFMRGRLVDEFVLVRAKLRVRRAVLSDKPTPQLVLDMLGELQDLPWRLVLGNADSAAARSIVWRASDDMRLADDAARYLRLGSSHIAEGKVVTRTLRKRLGIGFVAVLVTTWLLAFGRVVSWIWVDPLAVAVYVLMAAAVVGAMVAALVADLRREIRMRDALNAANPLRAIPLA